MIVRNLNKENKMIYKYGMLGQEKWEGRGVVGGKDQTIDRKVRDGRTLV